MKINKGMYILSDTCNLDDWYETKFTDMFIITDEEDLKWALNDWLKFLGYTVQPGTDFIVKPHEGKHYDIGIKVKSLTEALDYNCYLINLPSAKEALASASV